MSASRAGLVGVRLLVTRPPTAWTDLARHLEAEGAQVHFRAPVVQERCADPSESMRILDRASTYDWIVVTSPTAARLLAEEARAVGRAEEVARARFAAVGPATASALRERGWRVELLPRSYRGSALAESLAGDSALARRVLWVRAERPASDIGSELEGRGVAVDELVIYRTVPAPDVGSIAGDVAAGAYDGVVVTSPSSLVALLAASIADPAALRVALDRTVLVALGPTTAGAIEREGFRATAVAETPETDAIVAVLEASFAR